MAARKQESAASKKLADEVTHKKADRVKSETPITGSAATIDLEAMAYFKLKKWLKAQPQAKNIPKERLDTAFGKPELIQLAREYGLV